MKSGNLLLGLMACAAMCACTDDDAIESGGSGNKVFTSDKAYMVVNIQDVGSPGTRGTTTEDEFDAGVAAEHAVNDANFYFYDSDGSYYGEGTVLENGDITISGEANSKLEFESNTVVVLSGLKNNTAPCYVVTVLNKPSDFSPASTLKGMETMLASESGVGIMKSVNGSSYFTMSTTSYFADSENPTDYDKLRKDDTYYFATKITTDDFHEEEPIPEDISEINPVVIHVERLAAKVELLRIVDGLDNYNATVDGYEITCTDYNGGEPIEDQTYYVKLEGWTLNGIAKESRIVKNIANTWDFSGSSWGTCNSWNDPGKNRSYWGMSPNYGDENVTYPTSAYNENTDKYQDAAAEASNPLNEYLTYVNFTDENTTAIGSTGYEYCGENTNTADILEDKYSSAITNILVKAKLCDESGNGVTRIRCQDVLYTEDEYFSYGVSDAFSEVDFHDIEGEERVGIAYKDDNGAWNLYEINKSERLSFYSQFLEVVYRGDGYVGIALKEEYKDYVFLTAVVGSSEDIKDGEEYEIYEGFTIVNNEEVPFFEYRIYFKIDEILDEWNKNHPANGYKGGEMYYNIPIEHLNDDYENGLQEANYGVVRNHVYQVTITGLSSIGHGIFDPDEVIIPQNDAEKYYLGAEINILPWKIVTQSVAF